MAAWPKVGAATACPKDGADWPKAGAAAAPKLRVEPVPNDTDGLAAEEPNKLEAAAPAAGVVVDWPKLKPLENGAAAVDAGVVPKTTKKSEKYYFKTVVMKHKLTSSKIRTRLPLRSNLVLFDLVLRKRILMTGSLTTLRS